MRYSMKHQHPSSANPVQQNNCSRVWY
uniref:Uncharacterized protein n=1 Tax=Rhizophora mucronata TaxID=61149 RepID=A0A2P2J760_RHIMU